MKLQTNIQNFLSPPKPLLPRRLFSSLLFARRELSFLENKAIIEEHNSRKDTTFSLGFTPFADYTGEEFVDKHLKYKSRSNLKAKRLEKRARNAAAKKGLDLPLPPGVTPSGHLGISNKPKNADPESFPKNFDWADVPEVMGKIHTQEVSCASCWAYTSTDTIESQAVISGRRTKHVELSAEQLINCDGYDSGCNTGNMFTAYEWIHENGGLATARTFHAEAEKLKAARSAALTSTGAAGGEEEKQEPDFKTAPFSHGGFNPVVGGVALSTGSASTRAVADGVIPATALPLPKTAFLGERGRGNRNNVNRKEEEDQTRTEVDKTLSDTQGENQNLGVASEEALGAEEEKRVLDAIESGLGASSSDCPAQLPLQDRVYGYCELDFEAGEAALMEAVAKHPVAIGINANKVFQLYMSGIIRATDCGPAPHKQDSEIMSINHAVIVSGWGETHVNGKLIKYWVLKNSFGENWGEKGYFKLERGAHTLDAEGFGTCGMYFESVYPVMDENANPSSCVPGATFRSKYYSAATAAVLGAEKNNLYGTDGVAAPDSGGGAVVAGAFSLFGDRRQSGASEMAALLVGLGFMVGLAATTLPSSVWRLRRAMMTTHRGSRDEEWVQENASLLPH